MNGWMVLNLEERDYRPYEGPLEKYEFRYWYKGEEIHFIEMLPKTEPEDWEGEGNWTNEAVEAHASCLDKGYAESWIGSWKFRKVTDPESEWTDVFDNDGLNKNELFGTAKEFYQRILNLTRWNPDLLTLVNTSTGEIQLNGTHPHDTGTWSEYLLADTGRRPMIHVWPPQGQGEGNAIWDLNEGEHEENWLIEKLEEWIQHARIYEMNKGKT